MKMIVLIKRIYSIFEYLLNNDDFNLKSSPLSEIKIDVLKRKLVGDTIRDKNQRARIRQIIENTNKPSTQADCVRKYYFVV
mgnify:CR=1 FL=1